MTFYWKKLGCLFDPREHGLNPKLLTHAANPLPIHLYDHVYRIFYSGRDLNNRSSVGAIDINIVTFELVSVFKTPVITPGDSCSDFCKDGISIANCYSIYKKRYMLFMGWQNNPGQHWKGEIGRLEVLDDLKLVLNPEGALFTTDQDDPISLSYPWIQQSASGRYDMWYGSTISWDGGNAEMIHVIKHAFSSDGFVWTKTGIALPYKVGKAQAFSHPTVLANKDGSLMMWFSYRSGSGDKYRIGFASSVDGRSWSLDVDRAGITTSESGWDSEMIAYPFVFTHEQNHYMLYNGNDYGKTGFGLAVLKSV